MRLFKLIQNAEYGDWIAIVEQVRLHYALHSFDKLACASGELSTVPSRIVHKTVRLIIRHIEEVAVHDAHNG